MHAARSKHIQTTQCVPAYAQNSPIFPMLLSALVPRRPAPLPRDPAEPSVRKRRRDQVVVKMLERPRVATRSTSSTAIAQAPICESATGQFHNHQPDSGSPAPPSKHHRLSQANAQTLAEHRCGDLNPRPSGSPNSTHHSMANSQWTFSREPIHPPVPVHTLRRACRSAEESFTGSLNSQQNVVLF